jgi:predicted transposase/invertase (TIGR01784 family)
MSSRYINPYTDFGFKKLFGEEANKNLLINFLNSVLPDNREIADLTFRPAEHLPDNIIDRKAIFDITCTGLNGESFTVEMQQAKQWYFKDRALFYLSYPIQRQAQKGDWDFNLNPVFLVAILDFEYDQHHERRELQRTVTLKDQNGDLFLDKLQMIFLQMPLFDETRLNPQSQKDKWLYFLKNLESFDEIPAILREPVFEQAFKTAEWVNYPPEQQEIYRKSQRAYWDNVNTLKTAIEESEEKGRAEGRAEGRNEEKHEIACEMKKDGVNPQTIAKYTGLSPEEIDEL